MKSWTQRVSVLLLFLAPLASWGSEFDFRVERGEKPLSHLNIKTETVEVIAFPREGGGQLFDAHVLIRGKFTLEDGALVSGYDAVPVNASSQEFSMRVQIRGPVTPWVLMQVDPYGDLKVEQLRIVAEDWGKLLASLSRGSSVVARWSAGLGLASMSYDQEGAPAISQMALSGKVSALKWLGGGRWAFEGNLFGTLLPIASSEGDRSIHQWGANLRLGRRIEIPSARWELWTSGGLFLSSAFSNRSEFGYRNLWGGQFYPSLNYRFDAQNSLMAYAKWVPLFSLSEREVALGLGWVRELENWSRMQVNLDASDLAFKMSSGGWIRTRAFILGASFSP